MQKYLMYVPFLLILFTTAVITEQYVLQHPATTYDIQQPDIAVHRVANKEGPVKLSALAVTMDGGDALLEWATAYEQDAQFFLVERSADAGKSYEALGAIKARGNSQQSQLYAFRDPELIHESDQQFLYRIKLVNQQHQHFYTLPAELNLSDCSKVWLKADHQKKPQKLSVHYIATGESDAEMNIVNDAGKIVKSYTLPPTDIKKHMQIPTHDWQKGRYTIQLYNVIDNTRFTVEI